MPKLDPATLQATVNLGDWVRWTVKGEGQREGQVRKVGEEGFNTGYQQVPWSDLTEFQILPMGSSASEEYSARNNGDHAEADEDDLEVEEATEVEPEPEAPATLEPEPAPTSGAPIGLVELALDDIEPFELNPRTERFLDPVKLQELADDIAVHGLINPITVRETTAGERGIGAAPFCVISGERRYRASKIAGLGTIKAFNRGPISPAEAYRETIRENAQRAELNCLEEARAIQQMEAFQWPQEEIGKLLGGKSQTWVSQTSRLINLPGPVQDLIYQGKLTRSHAESLLPLARWQKDLVDLAKRAADEQLSTRTLNDLISHAVRKNEDAERLPLDEPVHAPPSAVEPTTEVALDPVTDPEPETETTAEPETAAEPTAEPEQPADEQPAEQPAPERPGVLKTAEEKVAEKHQPAVPTTVGADMLEAPVAMCMVAQDCVDWVQSDGFATKDFLSRVKSAAYNRGQSAAEFLNSLES